MKRTKTIYYYEDMDQNLVSPILSDRNIALKWERENKNTFDFIIFLQKRIVKNK